MIISLDVNLTPQFRYQDILAFHGRDRQQLAEKVNANTLSKGLLWQGVPACLTIEFKDHAAAISLAVDRSNTEAVSHAEVDALTKLVRHMLGLNQEISAFEHRYQHHPQLGALVTQQSGLRVPQTPTPYEAVTWAITGQQLSLGAATSLRRKLILAVGTQHSSGVWCYPEATQVAKLSGADLRGLGFSQSKAQCLITLSNQVSTGLLPLTDWLNETLSGHSLPLELIVSRLRAVPGIGPWTVDYALLRGFCWLDGSLHGDAAVRRNLQMLLNAPEKPTVPETAVWLQPFSPWRALVAAHLWTLGASADE